MPTKYAISVSFKLSFFSDYKNMLTLVGNNPNLDFFYNINNI